MKILYINTAGYISGAEKSLLTTLTHLPKSFEKHVMCPARSSLFIEVEKTGAIMHDWRYTRIMRWQLLKFADCAFSFYKFLKHDKFNIIHANSFASAVHIAFTSKLAGIPLIAHVRDIYYFSHVAIKLLKMATVIVANSQSTAKNLVGLGVNESKISVIYNSFDFSKYETVSNWQKPPQNGGRLLYVGQIEHRKGIDILLYAFKKIIRSRPGALLTIVGEDLVEGGKIRNHYQKLADEIGIAEKVKFTGFVNDVIPEYMNSDVFILPTRREPFGRVLVEAMACGLPVVASDVDGIPEIVDDGLTGLLVPPENTDKLADAILMSLNNGGRDSDMARQGRQSVLEKFSLDKQITELVKVYHNTGEIK